MDRLEDVAVEHVDADEGEVADRLAGLLDEALDTAIFQLGDTVLLGVAYTLEENLAVPLALLELGDEGGDAVFEHVVTEIHDEWRVAQEIFGDNDSMGEAEGVGLFYIGDIGSPAFAGADGRLDFGGGGANDDAYVGDSGGYEVFDCVEENRLISDRHKLFSAGVS